MSDIQGPGVPRSANTEGQPKAADKTDTQPTGEAGQPPISLVVKCNFV